MPPAELPRVVLRAAWWIQFTLMMFWVVVVPLAIAAAVLDAVNRSGKVAAGVR